MRLAIAVILVVLSSNGALLAAPITYQTQLQDGVPVVGVINQPNGSFGDPVGAQYYSFSATAGSLVEVNGDRLDGPYDMSFWVMSGLFSDTDEFGGFLPGPNFIAFADDEDPPFLAGPFGDPRTSFLAPTTGFYTIAVTNNASNSDPPFGFRLQATGIANADSPATPEPGTLVLFGIALALGIGCYLYKRPQRVPA